MKTSKSHSKSINQSSMMKQFRSVHVQSSQNIILNIKQKEHIQPKQIQYPKEFVEELIRKVSNLEDKQKQIEAKFLFYAQKLQSEIDLKQQVNQALRSEISNLKNTLLKIQSNLQSFFKTNQIQAIKRTLTPKTPSKKSSSFLSKQNQNPYSIKISNFSKNKNFQNLSPRFQISMTQRKNPNQLSQYQLQQQLLQSRMRQYPNDDYEFTKILTQTQNENFYNYKPQKSYRSPTFKSSKSKLFGGLMKTKLFVK